MGPNKIGCCLDCVHLNAPVVNADPELRQVKLKYNGICHYCPDCHTMVDTWDKFCRHCGVKFERSTGNG